MTVQDDLGERQRVERLRPQKSDFIGRKGFRQAEGSSEWSYHWRPNDGARKTRQQHEVEDMTRPWRNAETERMAKLQGRSPRASLRDRDGGIRYVDAALADQAARRNGWSHHWRARGTRVERGIEGGMLWRQCPGGWEPTGKACLGHPIEARRLPSLQVDPSGRIWRRVGRQWMKHGED